jgi:membrane protein
MHSFQSIMKIVESRIPVPKWVERPFFIAWTMGHDVLRCDLVKQSYAMAYITMLSLIPSLAAVFCVVSIFTPAMGKDGIIMDQMKDFVLSNLAAGSGESALVYINEMLGNLNLKSIGYSSFAAMLFTLILQLKQIEVALNRIWLVKKSRNIITRFLYFWTFLTLGALTAAILVGSSKGFNVSEYIGDVQPTGSMGSTMSAWAGGFVFFFFLYKIVPNVNVHYKSAAIGAIVSAVLLHLGSGLFGVFYADSGNYQNVYGALAALPLFLMWIWICWMVILFGSLIAWRMQQGFPEDMEEETIDDTEDPVDQLRNIQMRTKMPLIVILAIYRNFQEGSGRGLTIDAMCNSMKLPVGWITEAIDLLDSMGYVISTEVEIPGAVAVVTESVDSYFPAYPAKTLELGKLLDDLDSPGVNWMDHWNHDLTFDMSEALHKINGPEKALFSKLSLADTLDKLPEYKAQDGSKLN